MSRTSGTGWRNKQGGMGGGGGGRSRRHSSGGGDSSRVMSHGGGQGFGGRPARASMDGPGAPQGRGGGWGGNVRTYKTRSTFNFSPVWAKHLRINRESNKTRVVLADTKRESKSGVLFCVFFAASGLFSCCSPVM